MTARRALTLTLLTPVAASLGIAAVLAQSPPATPPAAPAQPPATAAPATPATPAPAAPQAPAATPAPATPPASAQAPANPPATQKDPFGEEVTITAKKVISIKGTANWDNAFESLTDSLKTLTGILDKQGIKQTGPAIIVYTSADDTGLVYQAQLPVEQDPKNLPKDVTITKSPEGKVLKFIHRGSYDNMDNTYEAITNHLDEKKLEAKDTFIEEYITDPLTTTEDKLVINVFVPLK